MIRYFDSIVRGTPREDTLVILQNLKSMVGQSFSLLNYYKEIPVSYDAVLRSVENEMAEFSVHEYQAKVASIEKRCLIRRPEKSQVNNDLIGEVFYANSLRKTIILCNFGFAQINSISRRYVRVCLDSPINADLLTDDDLVTGKVRDLSLGGAAVILNDPGPIQAGMDISVILKLHDLDSNFVKEVGVGANVVRIVGDGPDYECILAFTTEQHNQRDISYFINQRQVQIIKELKEQVL